MKTNNSLKAIALFALIASLLIPFMPVRAAEGMLLPAFSDFVTAVTNGQAGVVRGVFVPGVLADRVVLQSADNPGYVSTVEGVVTQFSMASQYGTIGLLAHNTLAGVNFVNLQPGQEVRIIYGDGTIASYTINSINRYQALDPYSTGGNFIDLNTGVSYTALEMFAMYYQGENHLTFQTCILQDGNSSWGRLFITATPGSPVQAVASSTTAAAGVSVQEVASSVTAAPNVPVREVVSYVNISHPSTHFM
jgi:hypothetical protein